MKNLIARFVREEKGQDLVEYAFLTGLIGLVAVAGVTLVGTAVNTYYTANIAGAAPFGG